MFALCKPDEERFSKLSEAAVLLSVLLSGVPVGIGVLCCQTTDYFAEGPVKFSNVEEDSCR